MCCWGASSDLRRQHEQAFRRRQRHTTATTATKLMTNFQRLLFCSPLHVVIVPDPRSHRRLGPGGCDGCNTSTAGKAGKFNHRRHRRQRPRHMEEIARASTACSREACASESRRSCSLIHRSFKSQFPETRQQPSPRDHQRGQASCTAASARKASISASASASRPSARTKALCNPGYDDRLEGCIPVLW